MRATLDFLLNDWLRVSELCSRSRFADHSADTFAAVLDTAEKIAKAKYAPFNRLVDTEEPRTETEPDGTLRVVLPQATHEAWAAYAESGMLSAAQDYEIGGMQLPYTVEAAAHSIFSKASVSISWAMLTTGNANLLMVHGTPLQKEVFAKNEFAGRWMGTMCLSEPQAGSSLSDIATRAADALAHVESINLDHNYLTTLGNITFCQIKSIEHVRLMKNQCLRRIEVFRAFIIIKETTGAESNCLSGLLPDRPD